MRPTVMYGAGDIRIETIPDAGLREPTDALIRVTRACICGSDLWPYNLNKPDGPAQGMGHEAVGTVEAVGSEVCTLKVGDEVLVEFAGGDIAHPIVIGSVWNGKDRVPATACAAPRPPR